MPQHYVTLDKERLMRVHEGLELLEQVDRDHIHDMNLCIFGLTNDPQILDAAREAIADESELEESDVQVAEVVVAIRISSDTIYALTGSGIKFKSEEFVYMGDSGKGARSLSFTFAHYKPTVNINAFSKLGLASSSGYIDEFLLKEGSKQPAKITPNVHRTEEATQPGTPASPTQPQQQPQPGATPAQPQQPHPSTGKPQQPHAKQTSLDTKFFDDFLDQAAQPLLRA